MTRREGRFDGLYRENAAPGGEQARLNCYSLLEMEPKRHLQTPFGSALCAGNLTKAGILKIGSGALELWSITNIKGFRAELEAIAFGQGQVLEEREVSGSGRRTGVALQAQVTGGTEAIRQAVGSYHRTGIEVMIGRASTCGSGLRVLAGNQIQTTMAPYTYASVVADGERLACPKGDDSIRLPSP